MIGDKMPIEAIKIKGKVCFRWGKKGKIYCGKGAYEEARKQGIAITLSGNRRG